MALSSYVYENENGEIAYLAGLINMLGDMYSLRLEKLGLDEGQLICLDVFKGNELVFEEELKKRYKMMNLSKKISNPIVRGIVLILLYIGVTIVLVTAVPYAIVKGVCNLDYYEDWYDFIRDKVNF